MWKKAVGILMAAGLYAGFFCFALSQAHASDGTEWTIGVPRTINRAFVCQSEEAAVTFAKMIHDRSFEDVSNNPTAIAYIGENICTWVGGFKIEPLSVAYHDTMHDDPQLTIKVVRATANPDHPDPTKTLY